MHRTPVLTSRSLDAEIGAQLFFKCENFQKVGAFKARGACERRVLADREDGATRRGHAFVRQPRRGACVRGRAARHSRAWVVMPDNAAQVKLDNVAGTARRFISARRRSPRARPRAPTVQAATGAMLVHPFDDARVIAGQGTAALELLEEIPDLDAIIAPVGGGGLLSGTAIAAKSLRPAIAVHGAEPANADDAARSFASGRVEPVAATTTIADGLRTTLSPRTLSALRTHVTSIGLASRSGHRARRCG